MGKEKKARSPTSTPPGNAHGGWPPPTGMGVPGPASAPVNAVRHEKGRADGPRGTRIRTLSGGGQNPLGVLGYRALRNRTVEQEGAVPPPAYLRERSARRRRVRRGNAPKRRAVNGCAR